MTTPSIDDDLPLVGISSCLTGQRVRYDGQDKFNTLVAARIAPFCRLLPFCPEAVAGMGIPRPPINLVRTADGIRARGRDAPHTDVTARLETVADILIRVYPHLCGYILQSRSPSCGLGTTPVFDPSGQQVDSAGSGILAARLRACRPDLPLLNDTDLDDATIEHFLRDIRLRAAAVRLRFKQ